MGRKPIDPEKKKKIISFTLTNNQRILCESMAKKLDISASEMIGKLIEKEAERIEEQECSPKSNNKRPKVITLGLTDKINIKIMLSP